MRRYGVCVVSEPGELNGVGRYASELVRAMAPLLDEDELLVLLRHRRFPPPAPHPRCLDAPLGVPAAPSSLRRAAEQLVVPAAASLLRLDLIHGVNHVLPLLWGGRAVVTVHDVRLFSERRRAGFARRLFRGRVYPASSRRADAVLALSRTSAAAIASSFGSGGPALDVVAPGVSDAFASADEEPARLLLAATPAAERPYLLHVGRQEPNKNLPRLVSAFAEVQRGRRGLALVLAGGRGADSARLEARIRGLGLEDSVVRLGHVGERVLPGLYRRAKAMAYPSLLEGFGLPILEAMAAGVPVLAGDIPVLRETAGDAALFANAEDASEVAAGLERLLDDEALRADLAGKGRAWASRFPWSRAAERTLAIYRRVAGRLSASVSSTTPR